MTVRVFPVELSAKPTFSNTWHAPREGGRVHEGVDVFAPRGSSVLAVDDGGVTYGKGKLGGNYARLTTSDGTVYYYAHLDRFEGSARSVSAGDVLGYVGTTGNAAGGAPHLHFEIRPLGGSPIDPLEALQNALPEALRPKQRGSQGGLGGLLVLWLLYEFSRRG